MRRSNAKPSVSRVLLTSALSLSALVAASPALAQNADEGDDIVVTGTRLADRTVTTSPAPIGYLRGADLRGSGYLATNRILRQLTPSYASATPTTPDGNTHIRSASLRGLSPGLHAGARQRSAHP